MVDAEAEPVGIAIDGGEVVDVEVYWDGSIPSLAGEDTAEHGGDGGASTCAGEGRKRRDGIGYEEEMMVDLGAIDGLLRALNFFFRVLFGWV